MAADLRMYLEQIPEGRRHLALTVIEELYRELALKMLSDSCNRHPSIDKLHVEQTVS